MIQCILIHFHVKRHKPAEYQRLVVADVVSYYYCSQLIGTKFVKISQSLLRAGLTTWPHMYLQLDKYGNLSEKR